MASVVGNLIFEWNILALPMLYRVVVRGGVWRRVSTDTLIPKTSFQGLSSHTASWDRVCVGETGKCVGLHQHRCERTRVCEASVSPRQGHTGDGTQRTGYGAFDYSLIKETI